jgi:biopolymer transport protein ExbD
MRSGKQDTGIDLSRDSTDLKPFINYLIVLIPVLMISAEFAKISVIPLTLGTNGSQSDHPVVTSSIPVERLSLSVLISDSTLTIGTSNGFLPSIGYCEFHRYTQKNDRRVERTVAYIPGRKMQEELRGFEKQDILLYAKDPATNKTMQSVYSKRYGVLLTDGKGESVGSVATGDTLHYVNELDGAVVVRNKEDFELRPLSAYDGLRMRLAQIRQRFQDQAGIDSITIASDPGVAYDKLIQVMDAVHASGFSAISISRLRG